MVPKNEMESSCGYGLSSFNSFDCFDIFYQIGFSFSRSNRLFPGRPAISLASFIWQPEQVWSDMSFWGGRQYRWSVGVEYWPTKNLMFFFARPGFLYFMVSLELFDKKLNMCHKSFFYHAFLLIFYLIFYIHSWIQNFPLLILFADPEKKYSFPYL